MKKTITHQYDAEILQQFADDLYERAEEFDRAARWITFWTAARYTVGAFVPSIVLMGVASKLPFAGGDIWFSTGAGPMLLTIIVGIALIFGVSKGRARGEALREKSFMLRLQAQRTLCQRQIEINTRTEMKAIAATV
jgi:hypothetical protein